MSKDEIRKAQERVIKEKKPRNRPQNKDKNNENKDQSAIKTEIRNKSLEQLSLKEVVNSKKDQLTEDKNSKEDKLTEGKVSPRELENLEQALAKEKIPRFVRESEYTQELSREPVQILYEQAKELALRAEEKGYLNSTEQRQIEYITGAIEEKVESGEYSFTEETARKASLTLQLAAQSKSLYKGSSTHPKSWYQSG